MAFTVRCPLCPPTAPGVSDGTMKALAKTLDDHVNKHSPLQLQAVFTAQGPGPSNWAAWYVPLNCHS